MRIVKLSYDTHGKEYVAQKQMYSAAGICDIRHIGHCKSVGKTELSINHDRIIGYPYGKQI